MLGRGLTTVWKGRVGVMQGTAHGVVGAEGSASHPRLCPLALEASRLLGSPTEAGMIHQGE